MIDRLELDMIRDVRNGLGRMSIIISDVISSCGIVPIRGRRVLLLKEGVRSLA
jgi:transposase